MSCNILDAPHVMSIHIYRTGGGKKPFAVVARHIDKYFRIYDHILREFSSHAQAAAFAYDRALMEDKMVVDDTKQGMHLG